MKPTAVTIRVRVGDANGHVITVQGREAWALLALKSAGENGCTPIDVPGPRWSAYVHDLRRLGIVIEQSAKNMAESFPANMRAMSCGLASQ